MNGWDPLSWQDALLATGAVIGVISLFAGLVKFFAWCFA